MLENIKKILNEDQDPKAIEKIVSKLDNLLMKNEEIGYIAVQKKPAITILPDSIVVTNKRIILCKPKNLGLSIEFVDYDWDDIAGSFVKEGIFGSNFTFNTKTNLTHTIDYLPKNQARKLYTFAKEQIDLLKNSSNNSNNSYAEEIIEEVATEEVTHFAEIVPVVQEINTYEDSINQFASTDKKLSELSQEELFDKLQNYKKLLDNGLILQGEYDTLKKEVLSYM